MLFVGVDWAEAHHDVCVMDEEGAVLGKRRVADTLEGLGQLVELVATYAEEPEDVAVGIEKDRGLLVTALVAAGFDVYAVNPMSASRYRERHGSSGSKSDPGDAKVLADLVRTDRHNHRRVAADTTLAEAVKVLARAHQNAIWSRQREVNALRNALKDYYPAALLAFGTELAHPDAVAVLSIAPTPALGRTLSTTKVAAALKRAGRQRNVERRSHEIIEALRTPQMSQPKLLEDAYGLTTTAAVTVIDAATTQVKALEAALSEHFEQHPDAKTIHSLPGMGTVLGARVLGEFGDAPNRYATAKSRRNYAATSPVTKASGRSKVVLARHAKNRRLADAMDQWAFCSTNSSPGARRYYNELRARDKTHRQAVRQLANRWAGILHAVLEQGCLYDEDLAWRHRIELAA
jgi:transposase/transposase IS116/IS110/IS902 family protein